MEIFTNPDYVPYILVGGAVAIVLLCLLLLFSFRRRRATEAAKREAEAAREVVVEHVADGVLVFDASTMNVVEANPAMCRSLGYERSGLPGLPVYDLVSGEKESVDEDVRRVMGVQTADLGERTFLCADGSLAVFEVSASKTFRAGREAVCVVARDIGEQREAESRVREAEGRYLTLVEQVPAIVYVEDVETHHALYDGRKMEEVLGYTADAYEEPGHRESIIHDEDRERVMGEKKEAVERGSFGMEYRVWEKGGRVRWVRDEARLARDEEGEPRFWRGGIFDITERKEVEEALRESEERYRSLARLSPDAVLVQSDGRFAYANETGARILGASSGDELVGRPVLDFIHPDFRQRVRMRMRRVGGGESGEPEEQRWLRLDGSAFFAEVSAARIRYLGRAAAQVLLKDLTARKEAEKESVRRRAELVRSSAGLEQFARAVVHDLRAPLRSMEGYSRSLMDEYSIRLGEGGSEYVEGIRSATSEMSRMVDELLDLSRLDRAGMECERVDLSELSRSVASELRDTHPDRRVEVIVAGGLEAEGDRRLLRTALHNLMENAWKFTGPSPRARVVVGVIERGGEPVFFVRDNGVGFDMASAGKLFSPFQRLHSDDEFEGSGVGLAAASHVIERHGGHIWAEGEPEKGATFYFTL